jgi:hypothetical protein
MSSASPINRGLEPHIDHAGFNINSPRPKNGRGTEGEGVWIELNLARRAPACQSPRCARGAVFRRPDSFGSSDPVGSTKRPSASGAKKRGRGYTGQAFTWDQAINSTPTLSSSGSIDHYMSPLRWRNEHCRSVAGSRRTVARVCHGVTPMNRLLSARVLTLGVAAVLAELQAVNAGITVPEIPGLEAKSARPY